MDQVKPKVFFVLGGPGAGKGTQSAKMVEKYHFVHLSAGDLLREERSKKTQNAELIEEIIKNGQIVPSHITIELLQSAMQANGLNKMFLIDGFPRNQENYDVWIKLMGDKVEFKKLFYFECDEQTLKNRIKIRAQESGRSDDNDETMIKRLKTYNESTRPIIQYFDSLSQCIHIKANKTVDEVFQEISMKLDEIL
ncbi:unnamed protein product [Paramecium sonneborni]|uniref:UMP/CMP kinase n=1 Tax=Paramecium sonneborni TaxID=65129 RepID=A0A8S1KRQ7_9CILI|nr:unnamed protein product [Paramecium sonneborni]